MTHDADDNALDDEEMKHKLEALISDAHPEEEPLVDPFATDGLGNTPAVEKSTGEPD